MRLRELDLTLPYHPRERSSEFAYETRCVAALFERCFESFETGGEYWKVLVEGVDEVKRREVRDYLGVLTVEAVFDFAEYERASPEQKKRLALNLLQQGIDKILDQFGWDPKPFLAARAAVLDRNFINEWVWKKPKSNPSRKLRAEVFCVLDPKEFTASMVIRDRDGKELKRQKLFATRPSEFHFAYNLGKLEWVSNDEVRLVSKYGEGYWSVRVGEDARE